jgi:hypothetical protein
MNDYECIRCKYKTNRKKTMIYHLNKLKLCDKNIDAMKYTDNEIFELSTTKLKDRIKSNINCEYCKKNYSTTYVLDRHKLTCKKKIGNEIVNTNITNNYLTNNNNNNNNNIYIINLSNNDDIKKPVPFDEEWKTDHITTLTKLGIIMSNYSFHELLDQILLNKDNLNVVIDNNQEKGYVYDSDNKYKEMNTSEIIDKSMKKLMINSQKIKEELVSNDRFPTNIVRINYNHMIEKYDEYCQNDKVKTNFEGSLKDIFISKKKESLDIYHNLKKNNNNIDIIC